VGFWTILGVISGGYYWEVGIYAFTICLYFLWVDKLTRLNRKIASVPMFIFFAVAGILSFGSSKRLMEKADKEEIFHKDLETWANEIFTKEYVEISIEFKENDSEEVLYFKRIEKMKKELIEKYPEVDPAYVDEFLDNLYQELYAE
jgi:hypothetical protein